MGSSSGVPAQPSAKTPHVAETSPRSAAMGLDFKSLQGAIAFASRAKLPAIGHGAANSMAMMPGDEPGKVHQDVVRE